jgi:hypothetical protein
MVGAALLLSACARGGVTYANAKADAAGKEFVPPMPGMSALYAYRGDAPPPATLSLWAGPTPVGWLGPRTWQRADIAPGRYDMRCEGAGSAVGSLSMELKPSTTYFLEVAPAAGAGAPCTFSETPETTGRAAVLSGRRTQPPWQ